MNNQNPKDPKDWNNFTKQNPISPKTWDQFVKENPPEYVNSALKKALSYTDEVLPQFIKQLGVTDPQQTDSAISYVRNFLQQKLNGR